MELGNNIRLYRKKKGLTQLELADKVGLSRTSIVNIEAGRQTAPLKNLSNFAKALETQVIYFFIPEHEIEAKFDEAATLKINKLKEEVKRLKRLKKQMKKIIKQF